MDDTWLYQVRATVEPEVAETVRSDPGNPALAALTAALAEHGASLKNHFDAFAEYVAAAEQHGVEQFPLYKWTKATIEDPVKKAKHLKLFTVHVGGEEVYPKQAADAVEAVLRGFAGQGVIASVSKHDTNPANNPQPPAHLR